MTFNSFVNNLTNNTLPYNIFNIGGDLPEESYLNWIYNNPEHLMCYSLDDFLQIYMELYGIHENFDLSDYDEAIEMKAEEMEQTELEKWSDITDLKKDIETFGYSDIMGTMSYDAW